MPDQTGVRADIYVAATYGISRARAQTLISEGKVSINGQRIKNNTLVAPEDAVSADVAPAVREDPSNIPVTIVYEDEDVAVVDKPPAVVVHPSGGSTEPTLVDALVHAGMPLAPAGGPERPGIVHRLDRMTSGLLLIAKTDAALAALQQDLRERRIGRTYWACVWGTFAEVRGRIVMPIGRDEKHPLRRVVSPDGKPSETHFEVVQRGHRATIVSVTLATGRTHQIRVHLSAIHHPVVGDRVYGRKDDDVAARTALHAMELRFSQPTSRATIVCTAPLPDDLVRIAELLDEGTL